MGILASDLLVLKTNSARNQPTARYPEAAWIYTLEGIVVWGPSTRFPYKIGCALLEDTVYNLRVNEIMNMREFLSP